MTFVIARHGDATAYLTPEHRGVLGLSADAPPVDVIGLLADRDFFAWLTLAFLAQVNRRDSMEDWLERLERVGEALAAL